MAHSCHLLKRTGLHQSKPRGSDVWRLTHPHRLVPSRMPVTSDRLVGGYKSQNPLPWSGMTLSCPLCSEFWVECLEGDVSWSNIFAQHLVLSWPSYHTSLFSESLAKNLYLRIFLWGAKTIRLSYDVPIPSPFLLSPYVRIEHYHTSTYSSKYAFRWSNIAVHWDNKIESKLHFPEHKYGYVFFQVQVEASLFRQSSFPHKDNSFSF